MYRSPEQLREDPEAQATKEGDVYSFAIILHETIERMGPFSVDEENCDQTIDGERDSEHFAT